MNRGAIYQVMLPNGDRPAVIVTRERAIPWLASLTVASITSTIRDLPTEVPVGPSQGLARECVVNADNLFTVPKQAFGARRGELGPAETHALDRALRIALDLD